MKLIGAHVSTSGGLHEAPRRAAEIGGDALALFVKNQRRWSAPPLTQGEVAKFRAACQRAEIGSNAILVHDGYLINLAHPEPERLAQSRAAFLDEARRSEQLGLGLLNLHPGSTLGKLDQNAGLVRVAESVSSGGVQNGRKEAFGGSHPHSAERSA